MTKTENNASHAIVGAWNRRTFLTTAAATVASTAVPLSFMSKSYADEPKSGGFARFALSNGASTDTLDPGSWADTFGQTAFYGTIFNGLVEVDPKGNAIGDLAETFETPDGGKTWHFKLRDGVTFHNGKPLTVHDVISSIQFHSKPDSRSAVKSLLEPVEAIADGGDSKMTVKLKQANLDFPYVVADQHFVIMPAAEDGSIDWTKGIGTGPFSLESFRPGISVVGKRNPHYHKPGLPHFDKVEFLPILDPAARVAALLSGEVNYIASPDLKTLSLLKRNKSISILENTGLGHYTFPMNVTIAPFDNENVRMALKLAMDREEILKKVFVGHALLGNDNPIAPSVKFSVDPKPIHSYDPEKAKEYLKKAGLDSLSVQLHASDAAFLGAVDAALLYKESAAKANINIEVVREPADGYFDNVWMKRPWFASFWSGRPTVDAMFTTGAAADAPWNETKWKNPRFNELLVTARSETDETKRAAMYAEMQQLVHDDGGNIVVVFNNFVSAYDNKLAHGVVAPHWEHDGFRIAERWWFA
ncbi:ABC transporter substrate-binding protein [Ochrobactrum sp. C6C9]|uniref:ABC transporter substrate-binding protein n=1 Tax=Ochrobactrum sp. C6C9 TaxID=2736662 RepID=UPI00352FF09E|nr:ABC transporter substrate-binding protein [Ochrobactrum sp. C6C9]